MNSIIDQIDPRIPEELSIGALDRDQTAVPLYWQLMTHGDEFPDEAFFAVMRDDAQTQHYVEEGLERATREIPGVEDTVANRIGLMLAANSVRGDVDGYYRESLGRPGVSMVRAFANPNMLNWALRRAKERKPGDMGFARQILQQQMENIGANLGGLHARVFNHTRGDGSPSIGWISAEEKTRCIGAVRALLEEREKYAKLWKKNKGRDEDFAPLWEAYAGTVEEWAQTLEATSAPEKAVPLGRLVCTSFLEQWGIQSTPEDLLEIAHAEEEALEREIERVGGKIIGSKAESPFLTNEEELAYARERVRQFKAKFVDSGILPSTQKAFDPEKITFRLKTEAELQATFAANANADGSVTVHPYEGQAAWWEINGLRFTPILDHEILHEWQYIAADPAYQRWMSTFSRECGAVASEWTSLCLIEKPSPEDLMGHLRSARRRVQDFILGLEFHLGIETDKEVRLSKVMETGLNREAANTVLAGMEVDPYTWGMYWLGSRLFTDYVDACHDGAVVTGFQAFAKDCQTAVPPHVLIPGFNPGNHQVRASTPMMVRLSQQRLAA
jgi:hypothetical protein